MKVAVSFLKSLIDIKKTIKKIDESNADYIHVDLTDGKFVETKNYSGGEFAKLLSTTTKPLDVHIMGVKPLKYLEDFAMLNTEYFTFHYEIGGNLLKIIESIKNVGIKVGISIKMQTKIKEIKELLPLIDQVLVMSIEPGLGGQTFIEEAIEKIKELKAIKDENNYNFIINVDGGIKEEQALMCSEAGADMVVAGTFVCMEDDYNKQIDKLRNNGEKL